MPDMIIGALLIGLLTAYYFGIKPGIIAAGVSGLLFLIASIVPGASLTVYGVVVVFIVAVCLVGPRMPGAKENDGKKTLRRWGRRIMGKIWRQL